MKQKSSFSESGRHDKLPAEIAFVLVIETTSHAKNILFLWYVGLYEVDHKILHRQEGPAGRQDASPRSCMIHSRSYMQQHTLGFVCMKIMQVIVGQTRLLSSFPTLREPCIYANTTYIRWIMTWTSFRLYNDLLRDDNIEMARQLICLQGTICRVFFIETVLCVCICRGNWQWCCMTLTYWAQKQPGSRCCGLMYTHKPEAAGPTVLSLCYEVES